MGQEFDCDYIEKAGKSGMTDELIVKLFEEKKIGNVVTPIVPVSGGFMHRMYRVETDKGMYAVKLLNPGIMSTENTSIFSDGKPERSATGIISPQSSAE